jgi:hypothetical protein
LVANTQRVQSNNSLVFWEKPSEKQLYELFEIMQKEGEVSLASSMEKLLEREHLGLQELIPVQRSCLEIKASVIFPKLTLVNSEKIMEDLIGLYTLRLEQIIDKHLSTLMMESSKERGTRTMNTFDSVALDSQELLYVTTSANTTIKDLRT